jgi:hypothetical protein
VQITPELSGAPSATAGSMAIKHHRLLEATTELGASA